MLTSFRKRVGLGAVWFFTVGGCGYQKRIEQLEYRGYELERRSTELERRNYELSKQIKEIELDLSDIKDDLQLLLDDIINLEEACKLNPTCRS